MRSGIVGAQKAWEAVRAGTDQATESGAREGSAARTQNCQVRAISGGATMSSLKPASGTSVDRMGRGTDEQSKDALSKGAASETKGLESLIQPFSTRSHESSDAGSAGAE